MNAAEEGTGPFIVSGCNSAVLLEFLEEILDQMSPLIHLFIVFALFDPVSLGRYNGLNFGLFEQIKNTFVRIISFIGQEGFYAFEKIG